MKIIFYNDIDSDILVEIKKTLEILICILIYWVVTLMWVKIQILIYLCHDQQPTKVFPVRLSDVC